MNKYFICLIAAEDFNEGWQECAAFRFRRSEEHDEMVGEGVEIEGAVELELARDLETVTRPEVSA
jgi:hypothetical protein